MTPSLTLPLEGKGGRRTSHCSGQCVGILPLKIGGVRGGVRI